MGKKIEIGELLPSMCEQLQNGFDECVRKNEHREEPYYILFNADWYANGTQLRCVFSPREVKPPLMLNTICWRVDNKKGSVEELWVLPKDAPIEPGVEFEGVDDSIIKVAQHLPIFYN